ncbi:MAG: NADP-dependent isocitrate dehydrogenase, partial [Flavobacteriaceae bacterium]
HLGSSYDNKKAIILSEALDDATEKFLDNKKSPSRKVNELDNRGSHFYLTHYWAEALALQNEDEELKKIFSAIEEQLSNNEKPIIEELNSVQGVVMDIGGYYDPSDQLTSQAMRPSKKFNEILASL